MKLLALFVFLIAAGKTLAQGDRRAGRWFQQARQYYSLQQYQEAIETCDRILERDSGYVDAYLLMADIFRETRQVSQEFDYLEIASEWISRPLIFFRLGEAGFSLGKYEQALFAYRKYLDLASPGSKRVLEAERKIENCRFAMDAMKHPVKFQPQPLSEQVNSEFDEYWPSLTIDGARLVFTRLLQVPGQLRQEDFYTSELDSLGWSLAQALTELNTPENEGAQSISADGRMLFFTACNRVGGMGSCDIYYSLKKGDRWGSPVNLGAPVNSGAWEAQPSLSSDGETLFFTSNRPGGKGEKDIWFTRLLKMEENGRLKWSEPINAGDSINSPGNEISPFVHASNKSLYFASDFHTGMGGYDLFMASISQDSVFSWPVNLGYPVNTFNNEQGIFISTSGETAFFSSTRNRDQGLDIFTFKLDESIRPEPATYVRAKVTDASTRSPVQAQIQLDDLTRGKDQVRTETTDSSGELLLCLPAGADYAFSVSKQGYLFYSDIFRLAEHREFLDPYHLDIELMPVQVGAEMNLYNIYFETDSFAILPPSEPELMRLVRFLNTNPGLSVEVQGHTDNTGISSRNQTLSELRAQSVVRYLVEKGISKNRLKSEGYGENRPVAGNDTPEGRQLNRRTTIRILEN